jgi:hypothetical protein
MQRAEKGFVALVARLAACGVGPINGRVPVLRPLMAESATSLNDTIIRRRRKR